MTVWKATQKRDEGLEEREGMREHDTGERDTLEDWRGKPAVKERPQWGGKLEFDRKSAERRGGNGW